MPTVELNIKAQVAQLSKGLKDTQAHVKNLEGQVQKSTKNVESNFKKAGAQVMKFAGMMGIAFGGAMVLRGLKSQVNMFKEFEKSMANVMTLLSASQKQQFGTVLKAGAARLMGQYGLAIQDVNKALFDTISAGVDAADSIEFLDEAAKLAIGGVTDLSTAVDGMTSILNAYGLAATEANKISSAFFTAQKFGKTTVGELASTIGQIAPIAKTAGISFQELLSAMALLTKQGIQTDMAATALRATITALISPDKMAADAFEKLSIKTGITAIRQEGLAKTLLQVARAAETDADKLTELIPNVRALNAVAAMGEEALVEYDEILKDVNEDYGEGSSLSQALATQMETLEKRIDAAGGSWRNFILSLTEQTEGTATDFINAWTWAFNLMAEKNREMYIKLGGIDHEYIEGYVKDMKKGASEVGLALSEVAAQRAANIKMAYSTELAQYKKLADEEKDIRKNKEIALTLAQLNRLDAIEEEKEALKKSMITQSELILRLVDESKKAYTKEKEELKKIEDEKIELREANFEKWKELEGLRLQTMEKGFEREVAEEELKYQILLNKYKDNLEAKELAYTAHMLNLRIIAAKYLPKETIPSLVPPIEQTESELEAHAELMELDAKLWGEIQEDTIDAVALKYDWFWNSLSEQQQQQITAVVGAASQMLSSLQGLYQAQMNSELQQTNLTERQKEAIKRKYYKKEQNAAILQAIINGALGVTQAFAQGGIIGYITGALVAAAVAIQIATIKAQKFEKGTYQVLKGNRHSQGGVDIGIGEAEEGEGLAVFSRSARRKYGSALPDLVKAINDRKLGMFNVGQSEKLGRKADMMMHRVSLDESKDLKAIRRLLEKQTNVRIEGNYRIIEKPGLIRKIKLR